MKNICIVIKNINIGGGISRVVSCIANELVNDYDVTILSFESNYSANKEVYNIDEKIRIIFLMKEINNYKKEFIKISRNVKKILKSNSFDTILIAGMDFVPFFYMSLSRLRHCNMIAWEHANHNIGNIFGLKWMGRKIAARHFNKIVVLTDRDRELYVNKEKLRCGIERIYDPCEKKVINNRCIYNKESKKIMSCGMLIYQKGIDYAILVAEKVFEKHPDWIWEVWGEGPKRYELEKKIKEKKLEDHFKLRGYSDSVTDLYQDYALFVLTSRYEGFGMVIVEALSNNLPVVAFNCDAGPSEIIEEGVNGSLIDCFEIEKMSNQINALIENVSLRESMSRHSNETLDKFELKLLIEQWKKIL